MTENPDDSRWIEDPELAETVAEVEQFVASAGWDAPAQLFALVATVDLIAADPSLRHSMDGAGTFTAIAQDQLDVPLVDGEPDLSAALSRIAWPAEVTGCVLVQEILVLPPSAAGHASAATAAADPARREARLVAGVLRGRPGGACLLRLRPDGEETGTAEPAEPVLRGGDLAPNLLAALQETFAD